MMGVPYFRCRGLDDCCAHLQLLHLLSLHLLCASGKKRVSGSICYIPIKHGIVIRRDGRVWKDTLGNSGDRSE